MVYWTVLVVFLDEVMADDSAAAADLDPEIASDLEKAGVVTNARLFCMNSVSSGYTWKPFRRAVDWVVRTRS